MELVESADEGEASAGYCGGGTERGRNGGFHVSITGSFLKGGNP